MSQSPQKSALPALDRGLHILDQLIRSEAPIRYNELKASLPGIQDSTLSRILKALESYGYIQRDADTGYAITHQVRSWASHLRPETPNLSTLAQHEVDQLVEHGQESAAAVLLNDGLLTTIAARSQAHGIQVLQRGDRLHYEADHAGAIAVLASLSDEARKQCLAGPAGRFEAADDFESIYATMQHDAGWLIDRSRERPGVCRLAQAFCYGDRVGAIFYCLTIEAYQAKCNELGPRLQRSAQRLEQRV